MTLWTDAALWTVIAVVGVVLLAFLWWVLSDLILATIELPFAETLARWRQRLGRSGDDANAEA